jgi:Leucine-rich repeat (LRR) protein
VSLCFFWVSLQLAKTDTLILSYSRVKTITGLSTLRMLVKLRLDNNEIEHISGLNDLVNLRELDLSMNRIKTITGLKGLRQLTDLTLFCNQISVIEGLDDQKACLEVLSIGRNQISDQSSIVYLRGFSALRIVCLEQNPISQVSLKVLHTFTNNL